MPTPQRSKHRGALGVAVRDKPVKIQVGARGVKNGPDWIAIDLFDTSDLIDHNWDLMDLPIGESTVDCFVCNAVLEHVPHPELAVAEMHRTLKPGGQIWVEVPFLQFYHAHPHDYMRWTLAGLEVLMSDFARIASGVAEGAAYEAKKFVRFLNSDAKRPVDEEFIEAVARYVSERESLAKVPRFYSSVYLWGEKRNDMSRTKTAYMDELKNAYRMSMGTSGEQGAR